MLLLLGRQAGYFMGVEFSSPAQIQTAVFRESGTADDSVKFSKLFERKPSLTECKGYLSLSEIGRAAFVGFDLGTAILFLLAETKGS